MVPRFLRFLRCFVRYDSFLSNSLQALVCGTHIRVCNRSARRDQAGNPATKTHRVAHEARSRQALSPSCPGDLREASPPTRAGTEEKRQLISRDAGRSQRCQHATQANAPSPPPPPQARKVWEAMMPAAMVSLHTARHRLTAAASRTSKTDTSRSTEARSAQGR